MNVPTGSERSSAGERPCRVVLADDDAPYRLVLARFLSGVPGLSIVGEAGDGVDLLGVLRSLSEPAHLAILDVSMPHMGGVETVQRIKSGFPGMRVLILTIHSESEYVLAAFLAGADGYVLKSDIPTELPLAIDTVRRGGRHLSSRFRDPGLLEY